MDTSSGDPGESFEIQGKTIRLPAIVRDASSGTALYLVPVAAAQALVPAELEIIDVGGGQAQAVVGFVDYRDNDLGDYNEVMVVFFVRPVAGGEPEGTFIYQLPVNQSFTCEAGRRIWGLPKTVSRIDISGEGTTAVCRLEMDGRHVLTLELPRLPADGTVDTEMEMTSYSRINGLAAFSFIQGGATALNPGGSGVRLELGDHPIAGELRSLGLPDAPLLMSTWVDNMRGSFGPLRYLDTSR